MSHHRISHLGQLGMSGLRFVLIFGGLAAAAQAATVDVAIQNFAFNPATLTINEGDSVRWTQKDSTTHTSTSGANGVADGLWDSGNMTLAANSVFTFDFSQAGTYPYFCMPHRSFMRGTITVKAVAAGPTIQITSPTNSEIFTEPATFPLTAEAAAGGSPIASVQFFSGTNSLATLTAPPWTTTVSNLVAGSYSFTAEATDSTGQKATSAAVAVTVTNAAPPQITSVALAGLGLKLEWTGGTAPFLIQKKTSLADTNWLDVATTSDSATLIARDEDAAYLRVQSGASQTAVPFTVWLTGEAERPEPVATTGSGFGTMTREGNTLRVRVKFSGLSAPATASHIHGPATTTNAVGVMLPFNIPNATSGVVEGVYDLTSLSADQITALMQGHTYMNIHTTNHPAGEIRGQIAPVVFEANLTGDAERPDPVTTSATGYADLWLIGNELTYDVDYANLGSNALMAHIHGPSDANGSATVLVPFSPEGALGTTGAFSGRAVLTQQQLGYLVDGLTYVNVHSTQHGGGEIRGQVAP